MKLGQILTSRLLLYTFGLCLTFVVAIGLLTVNTAVGTTPLFRQAYAERVAAVIATAEANMTLEDRFALQRGLTPSPDGLERLEHAARLERLREVTFWRGGRAVLRISPRPLNNDETARMRPALQREVSHWSGRLKGVRASEFGLVLVPFPNRPQDPVSVVMPYAAIRRLTAQAMWVYTFQPAIAVLISLVVGYLLLRALNYHLQTLRKVAGEIADGRLRVAVPSINSADSLGDLYRDIGRMQANLAALVRDFLHGADEIGESGDSLGAAASEASRTAQSIAGTMSEMSNGIGELAGTIRDATELIADMTGQITASARAAETMTSLSQETLSSSESGRQVVETAFGEVSSLTAHVNDLNDIVASLRAISTEIGDVVQFISSVAEQTNLLALNASIEAAHAGEFGVTFSVLAERIQLLSADAAAAGEKIRRHVQSIVEGISRVDLVVSGSRESFGQAVEEVRRAGDLFSQIEGMVREIAGQSELVSRNTQALFNQGGGANDRMQSIAAFSQEMAASIQEVAASAEEQAAASEQVGRTAEELVRLSAGFREASSRFET